MKRAAALLFLLAACTGPVREPGARPEAPPLGAALPAGGTAWSNAGLAEVFGALTFELEWGASRAGLVRLPEPVTVALDGPGAAAYAGFLRQYLGYLADGTGIAIEPGGAANLHVRLVEGRAFAQALRGAACVVTPGDRGWAAFRRDGAALSGAAMAEVDTLEAATIFIPADAPPHLIRACLIEEIAQALGPANDLSGLGPSIFNDDAAHLWPTAVDLMMLRVLYAHELRPGMGRAEAEAAARVALDRLNPAGRAAPALPFVPDAALGDWRTMAGRVHERDLPPARRIERARAALRLAEARAPGSPQACRSRTALGRALIAAHPAEAAEALAGARALCAAVHGAQDIRVARLRVDEGAARLAAGDPAGALAATDAAEGPLAAHAQDERLAALYAVRARAYRATGEHARAEATHRLAAAWGAYALGADEGPASGP